MPASLSIPAPKEIHLLPSPLVVVRYDSEVVQCPDPEVKRPDPRGSYETTRPISVIDVQKGCLTRFVIPEGFHTDLASVPRIFWSLILDKDELGLAAPIVHDFLYRSGGRGGVLFEGGSYTRAMADRLFYDLMRADGVSRTKAALAYAAVRVGGFKAWQA